MEIVAAIEGVFPGVGDGVLHVVVAEVEVAAGGYGEGDGCGGEGGAKGVDAPGDLGGVKIVDVVRVGGGDYVGYAVVRGDPGHGHGRLEVGRAVVEAGKQMMMKVDHASYRQSTTVREFIEGKRFQGFRQRGTAESASKEQA
jgi:hypothetical protein